MFDALACQSGCCRGGHSDGDRCRMLFDRQRDRATGATRSTRSQPQLRLCRRSLRAVTRRLDPGNAGRRARRSALQRRGMPIRADAGRHHDRRDLLLVRDRQPGPRADTCRRARRDHHRNRCRAAQGVPGAARHHRRGVLGHRRCRHRGAELVGAVPRDVRSVATRARTPKSCSPPPCSRTCDHGPHADAVRAVGGGGRVDDPRRMRFVRGVGRPDNVGARPRTRLPQR